MYCFVINKRTMETILPNYYGLLKMQSSQQSFKSWYRDYSLTIPNKKGAPKGELTLRGHLFYLVHTGLSTECVGSTVY